MRRAEKQLRVYFQAKIPDLKTIHDELTADTIGDLYVSLVSVFAALSQEGSRDEALDEVQRRVVPLAMVIARRRLSDMFRDKRRAIATLDEPHNDTVSDDGQFAADKRADVDAVLSLVLEEIARLDYQDRDLMMLVFRESGQRGMYLGTTERKRLSRIRARLRHLLEQKTGLQIDSLFAK